MKLYERFFTYIEHNLEYINEKLTISTFRQRISSCRQIVTQHKERAGEPALSKPSYMGLFLETA